MLSSADKTRNIKISDITCITAPVEDTHLKLWLLFDTECVSGIESIIETSPSESGILEKTARYCLRGNDSTYLEIGYIDLHTGEAKRYNVPEKDDGEKNE
ncbi:hypothetical protein ACWN8V_06780 [Vagococcus elongatus]|uniref:Uncharacterized protein n=1 Tax=Vagococcus elongatus TaxID=180344 RepID=A0A430AW12_9ENTE|nr:hypothetical protein [Vagococcus elongatus]RSU12238.1 hypothetical protein CBF29_06470 [Vagococcus elongatus]